MHGRATHVCKKTHGAYCAFACRAPPHLPLMPVVQQLRSAAQSPFDVQLSPAPCFALAVAVSVGDATSGGLDATGAIVTVAGDCPLPHAIAHVAMAAT